jgi:hypothetical protein
LLQDLNGQAILPPFPIASSSIFSQQKESETALLRLSFA